MAEMEKSSHASLHFSSTVFSWTAPTAFLRSQKQNKCQLNPRKGTERTKPKYLEQRTGEWGHRRPQSVLSWIPGSAFTGVHRAFSYGYRERSLESTERSLMDTWSDHKAIVLHIFRERDAMTLGTSAGSTTVWTSKPGRMNVCMPVQ